MEQSWPGWPCAGLVPAATEPGVGGGVNTGAASTGAFGMAAFGLLAGEFNGAPTGISQRWLGSPWAGLSAVVAVGVAGWVLVVGCTGAVVAAGVAGVVFSVLDVLLSEHATKNRNEAEAKR